MKLRFFFRSPILCSLCNVLALLQHYVVFLKTNIDSTIFHRQQLTKKLLTEQNMKKKKNWNSDDDSSQQSSSISAKKRVQYIKNLSASVFKLLEKLFILYLISRNVMWRWGASVAKEKENMWKVQGWYWFSLFSTLYNYSPVEVRTTHYFFVFIWLFSQIQITFLVFSVLTTEQSREPKPNSNSFGH